jgi:hypothetical protein
MTYIIGQVRVSRFFTVFLSYAYLPFVVLSFAHRILMFFPRMKVKYLIALISSNVVGKNNLCVFIHVKLSRKKRQAGNRHIRPVRAKIDIHT